MGHKAYLTGTVSVRRYRPAPVIQDRDRSTPNFWDKIYKGVRRRSTPTFQDRYRIGIVLFRPAPTFLEDTVQSTTIQDRPRVDTIIFRGAPHRHRHIQTGTVQAPTFNDQHRLAPSFLDRLHTSIWDSFFLCHLKYVKIDEKFYSVIGFLRVQRWLLNQNASFIQH